MKLPFPKCPILALLIGACLARPVVDSPVGVWRGESLCAGGAPSCHDEKVVYYVEAIADKPDFLSIRADKIVEGKAITMGSGPWPYNRTRHTLSWETGHGRWLLNINGERIEGTLTTPESVVIRRMMLTKDHQDR